MFLHAANGININCQPGAPKTKIKAWRQRLPRTPERIIWYTHDGRKFGILSIIHEASRERLALPQADAPRQTIPSLLPGLGQRWIFDAKLVQVGSVLRRIVVEFLHLRPEGLHVAFVEPNRGHIRIA